MYSRVDQVKFFKGCLPQILLGSFSNTLTHISRNTIKLQDYEIKYHPTTKVILKNLKTTNNRRPSDSKSPIVTSDMKRITKIKSNPDLYCYNCF